jgi:hypothetical protein
MLSPIPRSNAGWEKNTMLQPITELVIAYSRNVYEIATEAKVHISKVVDAHVAETSTRVTGMVETALQSAPAGSETAVAAIRQAIGAASSVYDSVNKAAKQVVTVAEANVAAAGDAALTNASSVVQKAKKAA